MDIIVAKYKIKDKTIVEKNKSWYTQWLSLFEIDMIKKTREGGITQGPLHRSFPTHIRPTLTPKTPRSVCVVYQFGPKPAQNGKKKKLEEKRGQQNTGAKTRPATLPARKEGARRRRPPVWRWECLSASCPHYRYRFHSPCRSPQPALIAR